MGGVKYEVVEVGHAEIVVDVSMLAGSGDMFFNATDIAADFGKRPKDWLRTAPAREYIAAVEAEFKGDLNPLKNQDLVQIRRGKYGGTYLHHELAMEFAGWCSALFRRQLHKWAEHRANHEKGRYRARLEARTGFLPMSEAVQAAHEDPQFYHYANEARMLCKLVTGYQPNQFCKLFGVENARYAMSAAQLSLLSELEALNTALIKQGMAYADRKSWLLGHLQACEVAA